MKLILSRKGFDSTYGGVPSPIERAEPSLHVIFGWLQVGAALHPTCDSGSVPRWAAEHPHVQQAESMAANNTLYIAARCLNLPGMRRAIAGAGVFDRHAAVLTLTAPGPRRSLWRLPRWMYPRAGKPPLSYHSDNRRWKRDATGCYLQTVGRGQEFGLDCDFYPEAIGWLGDIFAAAGSNQPLDSR